MDKNDIARNIDETISGFININEKLKFLTNNFNNLSEEEKNVIVDSERLDMLFYVAVESEHYLEKLSKLQYESKKNNSNALQLFKRVFDELSINYLGTYCNFITFTVGTRSDSLFNYLLSKGVIIRPLNNYKLPEYLRVSLGSPSDNKVFIKYLKEFYTGTTK